MFFIAYTFKRHVHVFAAQVKIVSHSSLQDKYDIEIFLSPAFEDQIALNEYFEKQ